MGKKSQMIKSQVIFPPLKFEVTEIIWPAARQVPGWGHARGN